MATADGSLTPAPDEAPARAPTPRARVVVALLIGLASGVAAAYAARGGASDFRAWHIGAQLLLSGTDPYTVPPGSALWPFAEPLYYPLPALLVAAPVASIPLPLAAGLLIGASSAVLAWWLTASAWWTLWLFATPSFLMVIELGQWSPAVILGVAIPWLGALLAVKPNLGAALFVWRPSWRAVAMATAVGALSLLILPHWPAEWLHNLGTLEKHPAPLFSWRGAWLWLALLRWRSRDARLLLGMAAVPQLLYFADQLPLFLLARSRTQAAGMAFAALLAWLAWYAGLGGADFYVAKAEWYVLVGVYLPALVLVLRRPPVVSDEVAGR